jgi:hypothetical protein
MSDEGYTPIKVPRGEEEDSNEIEIVLGEENVEEPVKEEPKQEEKQEEEAPKRGRPKGSTNKKRDKRIKQLLEKADKEAQRAAQLEAKLNELEEKMFTSERASTEAQKDSLEKEIDSLTKRMQTALEEEDSEEVVKIQREITNASVKHSQVSEKLATTPAEPPKKEVTQQPEASEHALNWVDDHPEFNSDVIFHQAALGVNQYLISQGYNPDSEEFYSELDNQLSKRFPEYFDTSSENVLQSEGEDQKSSNASNFDDGTENEEIEDYPQTVAGASRTPTGSAPKNKASRKNANVVKLSEEDVLLCQQWGMDPKTFAIRKQMEQKKEKGEYTPVKIPRN